MFVLLVILSVVSSASACSAAIDIEFVVDGSTSITSADWSQDLSFLRAVVGSVQVGPSAAHVGVVQFSSQQQSRVELSLTSNASAVSALLSSMKQLGGSTAMAYGLFLGQNDLEQNARPLTQANRMAFLITDGQPDAGDDPVTVASGMKANGTEIFCIGVGSGVDKNLLAQIASQPTTDHLFTVDDWDNLHTIVQDLTFKSCVKVTSISPNHGPAAGGTAVLITGQNFDLSDGTVYVRFGSTIVAGKYGDANTIGALTPAGSGSVEVEISFDQQLWTSNSGVTFTYDVNGGGCPSNCSGHGVCVGGSCLCNSGWGGPACDGPSCNPPCVHGTCQEGQTCSCQEGWQGTQCQNPLIVCCHYCGIYNPRVQWSAECDVYTPGGPSNSPCTGYADRKLVKWWIQGSVSQGNCTDPMQCIFPANTWDYPRQCISNYGYCN